MIVFDEASHTYTNTDTNRKYTSVTTLLGKYKKPFDSHTHSLRVAEREGVTQQFVLESWKETTKIATDKGTKIHLLMENFIKNGEAVDGYTYLYKSYEKAVQKDVGSYKSIQSEKLLFEHNYEIAGTADLIYENKDSFIVGDFKTNKKFRYSSDFNEYLTAPVDHLTYCEFNSYALQLSLYAYMHEQLTGKKCSKIVIFYLQEDRWQSIVCNYLKSDILNILKHYRQSL